MSKHTPGPWLYKSNGSYFDVGIDNHEDSVIPVYPTVCIGVPHDQEANARLIAAAPDLLEALEAVVRVADRDTVEFRMARAAIAKAKGEQP